MQQAIFSKACRSLVVALRGIDWCSRFRSIQLTPGRFDLAISLQAFEIVAFACIRIAAGFSFSFAHGLAF
jgi:hypothetical protein